MRRNLNLDSLLRQYKGIVFTTLGIILFTIIAPIFILGLPISGFSPFKLNVDSVTISDEINIKGSEKVKVYISKEKRFEEVNIEEYIIGVVSSEMLVTFNDEALKAQAVAARTYYFSKREAKCNQANGADICDTVHCQVYVNKDEKMRQWGEKAERNYEKIKDAVLATEGQVLTYDDSLVKSPLFFSTSSGKTEDVKDVFGGNIPYLKSTDSPGEEIAPKYKTQTSMKVNDIVKKINNIYNKAILTEKNIANQIELGDRSESGGVLDLKVGNEIIKGTDFRRILGLYSTNFTYEVKGDEIEFNCFGYGHGVGMSQWGANVMGQDGKSYKDILIHYYTGVEIKKINYIN